MRQWFFGLVLVLLGAVSLAPASSHAANLRGFYFEVGAQAERITILTDAMLTQKKAFMLEKPDRLVFDFSKFSVGKIGLPETYKGRLIRGVRAGSFNGDTTRLVFDLTMPVEILATYQVAPEGVLWRYVIDIKGKNAAKPAAVPAAVATPEPVPPVAAPKPAAAKKRIAIDAGHGGQDPGAHGKLHKEKNVTLRFAKALKAALDKTGRYEGVLVRNDDRFIALHERVNIARKQKADVFISLHADSNPSKTARGLSIYTVSENASDAEAEALAARENKSDIIDGIDLGVADADVADILIDLTQRETMTKSSELADDLVKNMDKRITLLGRTHRYAGFRVLKAPDIPSILVELGFLSNAADEAKLASKDYETQVAQSLLKGLDVYFARKK